MDVSNYVYKIIALLIRADSLIQQASTRRYKHQINVYPERMPTDFRLALVDIRLLYPSLGGIKPKQLYYRMIVVKSQDLFFHHFSGNFDNIFFCKAKVSKIIL